MSVWELCKGNYAVRAISAEPWRVVEAQHILSSRDLVDSIDEHELLEDLLEESKPPVAKEKNYLIFTPFRYPPLKYGSRFGRLFEPSLWYGSLELETALTEVAYYRLKFFDDSYADLGYVEISMTAFTALISCKRGMDLTQEPFVQHIEKISHKDSYEHSQLLGTHMREAQIDAFLYFSARTNEKKQNIAAFSPTVFQLKKHQYTHNQQNWKCFAKKQLIEFTRIGIMEKKQYSFSEEFFKSSEACSPGAEYV